MKIGKKSIDEKKIVIKTVPFLIAAHFVAKLVSLYERGKHNMAYVFHNISKIIKPPWPDYSLLVYICSLAVTVSIYAYHIVSNPNRGMKFRPGEEYGDARWGNHSDIEPFIDKNFYHNMIFSDTEFLSMEGRMPDMELNRNKNVLVIGSSGSGKTYGYVKPNILQMDGSYVVTDTKGTIIVECGKAFERAGYKIKVLNTIDFLKSMHYNPFRYIREEKDILKMANALFTALKKKDAGSGGDPFWDEAAFLWLQAHIGLIWYEADEEEKNMNTLIELLNASEIREDDDEFKNAVDLLFEDVEKEKGADHFAVRQYKKYKLAAGDICSK